MKVKLGDLRRVIETEMDRLVVEARDMRTSIRNAIENYTGKSIDEIDIRQDPIVSSAWAVRAVLNGETVDFLVDVSNGTINPDSDIEEVEFPTWPPKVKDPSSISPFGKMTVSKW